MTDFFDVNLLKAVLRMATPLLFAAMGGLICERSGIMNIGLEGMMLTGAFVGVLGTYYLHNPWWGLICAILAGGAVGLIHAFWSIGLRSDQIVTGTAINLLAAGITIFLTQRLWSQSGADPDGTNAAERDCRNERASTDRIYQRSHRLVFPARNQTRFAPDGERGKPASRRECRYPG